MKDFVQSPRIESELTCGHCGEEWNWTLPADLEDYEIECPGCGATWSSGGDSI